MDDALAIRASDAEREQAMAALRDAAAEGRLTFEELADRLDAAGRSTLQRELTQLTADLPVTLAHAGSAAATRLSLPEKTVTIFGDLRRSGAWTLPAESRWSTVFGDVVLDLREAAVPGAEVHIEASSVFGDTVLLVPEGVIVQVRSRTYFGDVRQQAGQSAPAGAPVVVLTGGTWFGDVRVQAKRMRERFADLLLRGGSR